MESFQQRGARMAVRPHWQILNNGPGQYPCYASVKRVAMTFAKRINGPAMILYRGDRPQYPTSDVRMVHHYLWPDGRVEAAKSGDKYIDHPNAAGA